jgi:TM2 domain-containing membrane protein YozV
MEKKVYYLLCWLWSGWFLVLVIYSCWSYRKLRKLIKAADYELSQAKEIHCKLKHLAGEE